MSAGVSSTSGPSRQVEERPEVDGVGVRGQEQRPGVHQLGEDQHVAVLDAGVQEPLPDGVERHPLDGVHERLDAVQVVQVVAQLRRGLTRRVAVGELQGPDPGLHLDGVVIAAGTGVLVTAAAGIAVPSGLGSVTERIEAPPPRPHPAGMKRDVCATYDRTGASVWSRTAACTAARTVPWKRAPVDTLGDAVGDRVLGPREVQRDAVVLERAGQVFERLQAGGVDVRHRLGVQDERGRGGRRAAQRFLHAALDVAGVGEEQAIVEPVDDDARRDLGVVVARDVGPASERVDPAEDGVVGAGAAADDVDHRQAHGEDDRFQDAGEDHADGGDGGDRELDPVGVGQLAPDGRLDQADRGGDDDRAEHRLGQVGDRCGQEQQDQQDRPGGEQAGDLAARAHAVVDGGARAAGSDREALGDAGRRVRGAHRQQLLVGADVLTVAAGERARRQHLVGERHEEQPGRGGRELDDVLPRRARHAQLGQPRGDVADDRDAVLVESERLGGDDRADDDDQRGGQPGHHVAGRDQQQQRDDADGERRRARCRRSRDPSRRAAAPGRPRRRRSR